MGKENEDISRRRFFLLAGWGGFLAVIGGSILAGIRFMVPTVLFETPRSFKLDKLDAFTEGATTYVEEHKIFILREKESLRCLSAICTHLGCTVSWDDMSGRFSSQHAVGLFQTLQHIAVTNISPVEGDIV